MLKLTKNAVPVIFLACLLVYVQSKPDDEDFSKADKKCLNENDITYEELEETWKQYSLNGTENINRNYKCYLYCLADELDVLDSDGNLDIDHADISEEITETQREFVMNCKNQYDGEEDSCEYAFNMMICIWENIRESQDQ